MRLSPHHRTRPVEVTDEGVTVFTAGPDGNGDLVVDAVAEEIVARIVRASKRD
ncbi:hypothetical protein ACIO3R_21940 [Streptomyces sp. NPDC087428]|uniref:hypothetical protein n=1 Tax=Streptomyces sp. NPDC087428 TaxID=3365788 RepID=UPI00381DF5AD